MAAKKPKDTAWDVRLSDEKRTDFTQWLCDEILNAEAARPVSPKDVEYWWRLYEQERTRDNGPWQDAADLTSYIGTEKTDALKARIMRTIMVDPVYTVEGWGPSAKKAPFVEDFHQWQLELEGLQGFLSRVMLAALIEPRAVLEVYEDTTVRVERKEINAKIALTPDGQFQLDADLQPVFEKDETGNFIEVFDNEGGTIGTASVVIDNPQRVRRGPGYRVLSYDNFLVLPGHAREKADIWGYAKKFSKRWDVLNEAAKQGMYDTEAIKALTDSSDITSATTPSGQDLPVAVQEGKTAEKELWEVQLLTDLGDGLRWYVATVHVGQRQLLRLKHDDLGKGRYIIFVPFPRTDRCHEGYSFVGHKMLTVIEEHTAWRNFLADHAAKVISAPVKRLTGALWDPDDQPMGPKAVIDVRDMNEVQAMDMPDLSNAASRREQEVVGAAERVAGINDVAAGVTPQQTRTLGETNLVAEQSFVRMDDVIKAVLEPMEELGQVRHEIWLRTLRDPNLQGMAAPESLMTGRGSDVTKGAEKITVEMLEGTFRFKPRGSTENADISRQRADYMSFLQALPMMMQMWPAMAQIMATNLPAAKSALEQALRLFRIPDKQAWIGNSDQWVAPPPAVDPMTGQPMPPGPPGLPPGMPPEIAAMMGGGGPPGGQ